MRFVDTSTPKNIQLFKFELYSFLFVPRNTVCFEL